MTGRREVLTKRDNAVDREDGARPLAPFWRRCRFRDQRRGDEAFPPLKGRVGACNAPGRGRAPRDFPRCDPHPAAVGCRPPRFREGGLIRELKLRAVLWISFRSIWAMLAVSMEMADGHEWGAGQVGGRAYAA